MDTDSGLIVSYGKEEKDKVLVTDRNLFQIQALDPGMGKKKSKKNAKGIMQAEKS